MQAGKRDIQEIFNRGRNLYIPFFQRTYVWEEEQWERFLDDMYFICETNQEYFLGSVILKQQSTTSNQDDIRTLIDGQQRLTTLNIFFKVLFLKINENKEFDIVFRKRDKKLILQHNMNDISSFEKILGFTSLEDIVKPKNQIEKCYLYFRNNINENKLDYDVLLKLITFVGIDLTSDENEQQIFDTINSLGVRLTTAELLKNLLFNADEISLYKEYWEDVFEKNEDVINYWHTEIGRDNRTLIDVFLLSFLQVKSLDFNISSINKSKFYILSELFSSYKTFLNYFKGNKKELLVELREYALIFKQHIDPFIVEKTISTPMDRINIILFKLETSTIIPYILYVIKNTVGKENQRNNLLICIESYILRRMIGIVKGDISRHYTAFFNRALMNNRILSDRDFYNYLGKINDSNATIPIDDDLFNGCMNKKFKNSQAIGILYLIESYIRDDKYATQLLSIDKYSLEHIMPKNWRKYWQDSDSESRDKIILTLGNLIIIPQKLNSSLKDREWEVKKEGNGKTKGLNCFAQGLATVTPYLELAEWNEETIEQRATDLYQYIKDIWKYEHIS